MKLEQKPRSIETIRREMDHYAEIKPHLKDLFDLYYSLLAIEHAYLSRIEESEVKLEDAKIKERLEQGQAIMKTGDLSIDIDLFRELIGELADVIVRTNPVLEEQLAQVLVLPDLKSDDGQTPLFIQNAFTFNTQYFVKIASLVPIDKEILLFLVYHAVGPFVEKASYAYRGSFDSSEWQRTTCPICGRKPSMAMLRDDDGVRVLQCSVCRSWWTYPRIKCAVCGDEDQDKLEYFYATDDEAHRVYFCNGCKKYIKTTDCRRIDRDIDLEVEDLATVELDIVAKERGYQPHGRTTFGISGGGF